MSEPVPTPTSPAFAPPPALDERGHANAIEATRWYQDGVEATLSLPGWRAIVGDRPNAQSAAPREEASVVPAHSAYPGRPSTGMEMVVFDPHAGSTEPWLQPYVAAPSLAAGVAHGNFAHPQPAGTVDALTVIEADEPTPMAAPSRFSWVGEAAREGIARGLEHRPNLVTVALGRYAVRLMNDVRLNVRDAGVAAARYWQILREDGPRQGSARVLGNFLGWGDRPVTREDFRVMARSSADLAGQAYREALTWAEQGQHDTRAQRIGAHVVRFALATAPEATSRAYVTATRNVREGYVGLQNWADQAQNGNRRERLGAGAVMFATRTTPRATRHAYNATRTFITETAPDTARETARWAHAAALDSPFGRRYVERSMRQPVSTRPIVLPRADEHWQHWSIPSLHED